MGYLENATLNNEISWVQSDNINDITLIDNGSVKYSHLFTSGTGVSQVNCVWYYNGTLNTGEQKQFDLFSLTRSIFGGTVLTSLSGGSVKAIIVNNLNTGYNQNLVFNTSGINAFNQPVQSGAVYITISPESSFGFSNKFGYNVTTGQRYFYLQDRNSSGVSYEVAILGVKL